MPIPPRMSLLDQIRDWESKVCLVSRNAFRVKPVSNWKGIRRKFDDNFGCGISIQCVKVRFNNVELSKRGVTHILVSDVEVGDSTRLAD